MPEYIKVTEWQLSLYLYVRGVSVFKGDRSVARGKFQSLGSTEPGEGLKNLKQAQ